MKPGKYSIKFFSALLITALLFACGNDGGDSADSKEVEQVIACIVFPLYCFVPVSKAGEPGSGLNPEQVLPPDDEIGLIGNATDTGGNVYSAGYTIDSRTPGDTGGMDAIVLKRDPDRNLQWFKRFGSADRERGVDVSVNPDGSVLVSIVKVRMVEGDAPGEEQQRYRLQLSENGEVLGAWHVMTPEGPQSVPGGMHP